MRLSVGENIAKYRKKQKLTQDDLAKLICVSSKSISSYENNRNLPNIETLILLSQSLNVSIDDLLGITKDNSDELKKQYQKKKNEGLIITIVLSIFSLVYFFFSEYMITGILLSLDGVKEVISMKDVFNYLITNSLFYGFVVFFLYLIYYLRLGEKKPLIAMIITLIVIIFIGVLMFII